MIFRRSTKFEVQFEERKLVKLAASYSDSNSDKHMKLEDKIMNNISKAVKRGHLTKDEFIDVAMWKSPRPKRRYHDNDESFIKEVTSVMLTTSSDELRIKVLTLLNGVSFPTASCFLHFCFDNYPILDRRALWSLGVKVNEKKYDYELWEDYTEYCRELAARNNLTMRQLDRALWQYSKENQ